MLGIKVNNLAEAIEHAKKLEQIGLKSELEKIEQQNRRSMLINERHKAAFTLSRDKKHQSWWNSDQFVREYFQVDFENVLSKRLKERLKSEQRLHKLKQLQIKSLTANVKNKGKKNSKAVDVPNTRQQQQHQLIKENDTLMKKLHALKFPELKQSLTEQYHRKAQRMGRVPVKNASHRDSKLFMETAERFLNHKAYNVENNEKLTVEEQFIKLKEKAYEKEKHTMKKCEEKFDEIITAFENDKNGNNKNGYYDDYYGTSYYF